MNSKQHFGIVWRGVEIETAIAPAGRKSSSAVRAGLWLTLKFGSRTNAASRSRRPAIAHTSRPPMNIESAGGPVAYVRQWLDWAGQDRQLVTDPRQFAMF